MKFRRLRCLKALLVCLSGVPAIASFSFSFGQQAPAAKPAPASAQEKAPPAQPSKKSNPFEQVPVGEPAPSPAKPQAPQAAPAPAQQPGFETPGEAKEAPKAPGQGVENIVESIEFRGSRRVPQESLRAMIFTRKGDKFDPEMFRRDFIALWNSGRFDDIRLEAEPGKIGWILRFILTERRVVRTIKYEGNKSITVSEILDRFKERKVGLAVESQYDPNKVQRAVVVLREYLAERGRQYADVTPQVRQIPPSSLEITFRMNEGPKVKVGKLDIEGNTVFSDRVVRRAMKNLKPIGIPYSILFENIFAKTYDSTKLEEDKDHIRMFYQDRGYFTARALDSDVDVRRIPAGDFKLPLIWMNRPKIIADVKIPIEEGRQYRLNKINFVGVKLFRTPETFMRPLFQMGEGDIFSTSKLRKGLDNLRKLYGEFGYIDFVPDPSFDPVPGTNKMDLTLTVDEGKQFFVRRIDFAGNTTTRDKVIRRELLIDEGDMYNTRLWEMSILRLNQLGYFEALKAEDAADIKRNPQSSTVDITLKVKERGKNSIQLNGGVSGIAGSFVGFGYSTNNFLGLGETLSLSTQLGDRIRQAQFGFTEPYLFDRPIQAGFTVYTQRFNYDQGREVSLLSGRNLIPLYNALGAENLLNYVSNSAGFTTFVSYPLRRSFARVGITYGFDRQNLNTLTTASTEYFRYINFMGVSGPNSLSGIKTSRIIPNFSYNTVNHPITPTAGKSIYISLAFAGSVLGGNVNTFEPTIDLKYFRPALKKGHVLGFHLLGRMVAGYGGRVAPPFSRYYMGGEEDIRGFENWGVTPIAYIPTAATINVLNSDGSARQQKVFNPDGTVSYQNVTMQIPAYQITWPGGDTNLIGNFEYRIPIAGPVTVALFFDAGVDRISLSKQLTMNEDRVNDLNSQFPQADFNSKIRVLAETQKIRSSTGIEFQVLMPVVNAPFRLYWAYNPTRLAQYLQPPIVADRSFFPNAATFAAAVGQFGTAYPWYEEKSTFRFTIGRTF